MASIETRRERLFASFHPHRPRCRSEAGGAGGLRRQLALLSLATTSLVVISLVVPLGLLVRRQASDRAVSEAEAVAQSTASLVALATAVSDGSSDRFQDTLAGALGTLPEGTVVVLPDDVIVGEPLPDQLSLVDEARSQASTVSQAVTSGWEVALPVVGRDGTTVVDVFVEAGELRRGVVSAWVLLGLLGLVLVGAAVLLAERLGRRLVEPVGELAASANRMADGDLEVRLPELEPEELREAGLAFNYLAGRLGALLVEERESIADLSHRLRTPLTSVRLEAEALGDPVARDHMLAKIDRLELAVSELIESARNPAAEELGECLLDEVVVERVRFWMVLADVQGRDLSVGLGTGDAEVGISHQAVETMIDVLIENVINHTPPGTAISISTALDGVDAVLEVADRGPGFGPEQLARGVGSGGSTGLGLDIARRIAESAGGSLSTDDRQGGGAIVRAKLPVSV